MRSSTHPPGHNRYNLKTTSISLAATLAAVALFIITSIADAARNITRALLPEPGLRLAPAGGTLTPNNRGSIDGPMLMINSTRAGRSDRRGSRHAAGHFGGGGGFNRTQ